MIYFHRPETAHDTLMIERKMLEIAVKEWDKMGKMGDQFANQSQKDVRILVISDYVYLVLTYDIESALSYTCDFVYPV